jgi:transcriptional regulator with XRE-family HTH domain
MTPAQLARIARIRADLASGAARERRKAAGIDQAEVASALGVTAGAVSHWESGRRRIGTKYALAYARLLERLAAEAA